MCKNEKERKCFVLAEPCDQVLQKETYYFGRWASMNKLSEDSEVRGVCKRDIQ